MYISEKQIQKSGIYLWVLLPIVSILIGCTRTVPVKMDMAFTSKATKIDKHILLEVPQDTRSFVVKASQLEVPIGQSVEPNALIAFSSIINDVTNKKDIQSVDRVVSLTLNNGTSMDAGTFVFSKNTFHTMINCEIKDTDGNLVWSKTINTESSSQSLASAVTTQIPILNMIMVGRDLSSGDVGYFGAVKEAANNSLNQALQELVDEIYAAQAQIFQLKSIDSAIENPKQTQLDRGTNNKGQQSLIPL